MAKVENGVLIQVGDNDIERLNNGESFEEVFGKGVSGIGKAAFYLRKNLTWELSLPDSVTSIGKYAFMSCKNLTGSIDFTSKKIFIDDGALV